MRPEYREHQVRKKRETSSAEPTLGNGIT